MESRGPSKVTSRRAGQGMVHMPFLRCSMEIFQLIVLEAYTRTKDYGINSIAIEQFDRYLYLKLLDSSSRSIQWRTGVSLPLIGRNHRCPSELNFPRRSFLSRTVVVINYTIECFQRELKLVALDRNILSLRQKMDFRYLLQWWCCERGLASTMHHASANRNHTTKQPPRTKMKRVT